MDWFDRLCSDKSSYVFCSVVFFAAAITWFIEGDFGGVIFTGFMSLVFCIGALGEHSKDLDEKKYRRKALLSHSCEGELNIEKIKKIKKKKVRKLKPLSSKCSICDGNKTESTDFSDKKSKILICDGCGDIELIF